MSKKKNKKTAAKRAVKTRSRAKPKKMAAAGPKPSYNQEYNNILEKAQQYLDDGLNVEAALEVEPLLSEEVRKEDLNAFLFASRIAAFAKTNLKKYGEAVEISLEALKRDANLLDFHFLLSFCYLAMEQYSLVEIYCNKYLELAEEQSQEWSSPQMLAETRTRKHVVYNYLGIAMREQERFPDAERAYRAAYRLNQKYVPAYINHARLLHGMQDDIRACEVLGLAIESGVESEEIRMLRDSYKPAAQVSVCMIVKNEEKMLDRCLSSVKGFADEIIVVDTGSTDRTVEIAESHGAKVYHHEWENDFSRARNYSLGYATREWIFILDADEEMVPEDFPLLRELAAQKQYNLVSVNVYNFGPEGSVVTSFLPSVRMFRRKINARYEGIVHNQLKFDEDVDKVVRVNARIRHYGYGLDKDSMKRKVARSRELLLKQIEENPENFFAHFNLAQLYRGESASPDPETCNKIIEHAGVVVANTDPYKRGQRHLHLMAQHQLVTSYFFLKDYDKAIEICNKAIEYKPNFLDPIISLGHIYSHKHDTVSARKWFMKYLEEQERYDESQETDQIILLNLGSRHIAFYGMGLVAEMESNLDEAIGWFSKCLQEDSNYLDTRFRMGRLMYNTGRLKEALGLLEDEVRIRPDSWAAHYIRGEIFGKLGRDSQAEEAYLNAYAHKQDEPNLLYALGRLYQKTNRPEAALEYLRKIPEISKEFVDAYRLLGDIHFQFGQYRESTAAYTNYVIRNAADIEVWNNLGNAHFKLREYEQARKCYEKVIELDNTYGLAWRNLAVCLVRMENFEEAENMLKNYLELAPDDYQILVMSAEVAMHVQNYGGAIGWLEKALETNPASPELLTMLGDCYYAGGFLESAKMGFEQALKLRPDYQPAKERLAQVTEILAERGN